MHNLLLDERSHRAVEAAELYADKLHSTADILEIEQDATQVVDPFLELVPGRNPNTDAAHCAALCLAVWAPAQWGTYQVFQWSASAVCRKEQIGILSCVFGVPYRQRRLKIKIKINPAWLTSDARLLATGIYNEKAFDRMPILADALQDAGCDNDDILNHFRDANPTHVRGCWALDLILGKE